MKRKAARPAIDNQHLHGDAIARGSLRIEAFCLEVRSPGFPTPRAPWIRTLRTVCHFARHDPDFATLLGDPLRRTWGLFLESDPPPKGAALDYELIGVDDAGKSVRLA